MQEGRFFIEVRPIVVSSPQAQIVVISGAPGAGKSTLALEAANLCDRAVVISVDDIREMVVSGRADPIPEWTDETARQFILAEDATSDIARRYALAQFTVFIDHCRLPNHIDEWVARSMTSLSVVRVALVPSLSLNLERNAARTNKWFDPIILEPVIRGVHEKYIEDELADWIVFRDNADPQAWANRLLADLAQ